MGKEPDQGVLLKKIKFSPESRPPLLHFYLSKNIIKVLPRFSKAL